MGVFEGRGPFDFGAFGGEGGLEGVGGAGGEAASVVAFKVFAALVGGEVLLADAGIDGRDPAGGGGEDGDVESA